MNENATANKTTISEQMSRGLKAWRIARPNDDFSGPCARLSFSQNSPSLKCKTGNNRCKMEGRKKGRKDGRKKERKKKKEERKKEERKKQRKKERKEERKKERKEGRKELCTRRVLFMVIWCWAYGKGT